jgi:hypothetical protein
LLRGVDTDEHVPGGADIADLFEFVARQFSHDHPPASVIGDVSIALGKHRLLLAKISVLGLGNSKREDEKTPESLELPGPVPLAIDKQLLPALAQFNKRT